MGRTNQGLTGKSQRIRQVWAYNFAYEISKLDRYVQSDTVLSIATEFPAFTKQTTWDSTDEQLYSDVQLHVNQTKVIKMGLTAMDESGNILGSWEFNFETMTDNPSSITFLNDHGTDFDKLKQERISMSVFARNFLPIIRKNGVHRWVTFQGLYDIGYLLKAMGVVAKLPESMKEFAGVVVRQVGVVRDLKHMCGTFCKGHEHEKLGVLERLDQLLLDQEQFGPKYNVGSYSLIGAMLHEKLLQRYDIEPQLCNGFLYGFSKELEELMGIKTKFNPLDWINTKFYLNHGPSYWK